MRFGILGCSEIAAGRTLPAMNRLPGVEVSCVASRSPERAERFAERFGGTPVTPYEALLERDDVDAVYLSLPTLLHTEWTERALAAGKHVLVEKPMTTTGADARRLFELADERGLVLLENFMFLHHGQQARVRQLLAEGAVGEVRAFSAAFTIPPRPEGDNRLDPRVGGGALLDNGVYPLRAALHFLGTGLEFSSAVLRRSRRHGVTVSGAILLHTPQGVPAQLRFGMEHHYRSWYEIQGSEGTLSIEHVYTTAPDHQPELRLRTGREEQVLRLPAENHFLSILDAFRAAAAGDGTRLAGLAAESVRQARLVELVEAGATTVEVEHPTPAA